MFKPFAVTAEVEQRARKIAARKILSKADPSGARLPDDLWQQAIPDALAELFPGDVVVVTYPDGRTKPRGSIVGASGFVEPYPDPEWRFYKSTVGRWFATKLAPIVDPDADDDFEWVDAC